MTAISKAMIADKLADKLGINKLDAQKIVNLFFEDLRETLARGEPIKLSGFGNFNLRDKGERPGRNPKTGEPVIISARRVVTFKQGLKLKKRIEKEVH